MPSRVPLPLVSSSTASSPFVSHSDLDPLNREPFGLHGVTNTSTTTVTTTATTNATIGIHGVLDTARPSPMLVNRSQDLGRSLGDNLYDNEHAPIYPSYSSSLAHGATAMMAANIAGDFHTTAAATDQQPPATTEGHFPGLTRTQQQNVPTSSDRIGQTTINLLNAPLMELSTAPTPTAEGPPILGQSSHTSDGFPNAPTTVTFGEHLTLRNTGPLLQSALEDRNQEQVIDLQQRLASFHVSTTPWSQSHGPQPLAQPLAFGQVRTSNSTSVGDTLATSRISPRATSTMEDRGEHVPHQGIRVTASNTPITGQVYNLLPAQGSRETSNDIATDSPSDGPGRPRAFSDIGPHPEIPWQPLAMRDGPLINRTMVMNSVVAIPRVASRRRYTTRDYSSGAMAFNDWLRHPNVIALSTSDRTPVEPATGISEAGLAPETSDATLENQENIPPCPSTISNTTVNAPDVDITHPPQAPLVPVTSTPHTQQINLTPSHSSSPTGAQLQQDLLLQGHELDPSSQTASDPIAHSTPQSPQARIDNGQNQDLVQEGATDVQDSEAVSQPSSNSSESTNSDHLGLLGPLLPGAQEGTASAGFYPSLLGPAPGLESSDPPITSRTREDGNIGPPIPWDAPVGSSSIRIQGPSHFYPSNHQSFTEILDCNGNPIEWNSGHSYPPVSSTVTHEQAEDPNGFGERWDAEASEQLRRRTQMERNWANHGIISDHGRSRIASTGTLFEDMGHISEADILAAGNDSYQSLKGSWVTNPNGESWSDDEREGPLRRRHVDDADDNDPESVFMRRGQPSLGVLQPNYQHQHGPAQSVEGDLYYIYGNVRNRYGPDTGMEATRVNETTQSDHPETGQSVHHTTQEGLIGSSAAASVPTGPDIHDETGTTSALDTHSRHTVSPPRVVAQAREQTTGSSDPSDRSGPSSGLVEGFIEYEQGHSHYHAEDIRFQRRQPNRAQGRDQTQQQSQADQHASSIRPPSAIHMNRTPPLLPTIPQANEPIPHQIRRAHTSHMMDLQRRWEQQRQQRLSSQGTEETLNSDDGVRGVAHRHPETTTFVPPPSQQELRGHTYSSQMLGHPAFAFSSHMGSPVVLSRGNRSSFRTSHDSSGFQHFQLSAIPHSLSRPTATTVATDALAGSTTAGTSVLTPIEPTVASSTALFPSGSVPSYPVEEGTSSNHPAMNSNQYWHRRTRGINSLYLDYEGGKLRLEERWRRSENEMVGR
ncbi:hypothetical protein B0O80DRAFT_294399 [Mortierella sp. GBAus27b]|nr:hypothetical protein B0O80DRAFT_294399 [Mortierella sp. GBAus27b]